MRLERSKDWWMARARREGDMAVGAGLLAFDPAPEERLSSAQTAAVEETRIAFGRFVNLMRRRRGYSMEQLAAAADLDTSELLVIEDDVHYVPELRTVFKLAQTFEVSQQRLMQLAGLAAANDVELRQEAVRFAARSESMQKLTPEESSALEAFVAVLSEQEPKRVK
ncbi:Helix-turn-helix domain-containing protein [Rhizobiales bacterium GAS191]|nr:Helix-turn-helix domain-containing protein [Rhizobiales bacterium GAS191]